MSLKHRNGLPEDLLTEILTRLPVKYIVRCMCVQKSWYSLIRTPIFINVHFNRLKITNDRYLLFKTTNSGDHALTVRYDDVQCEEYYYRPKHDQSRALDFLHSHGLICHSHGLICMSSMFGWRSWSLDIGYHPDIRLWNPLVQKCKTIPVSPLSRYCFGDCSWKALAFGFLPELNDYVVVHIVKPHWIWRTGPHSVFIGVYSLNTDSWKTISQDNVLIDSISYNDVVFSNGTAFWLGVGLEKHVVIMCFDTKTDKLRDIQLPADLAAAKPSIHLYGQSLACFVKDNRFNSLKMWVMKDDPINEFSWESIMSVSVSEDVGDILGVRNSGEPILRKLYDLISYNLDTHEPSNLVHSWNSWTSGSSDVRDLKKSPFFVSPFMETLVLLDIDCNNLR